MGSPKCCLEYTKVKVSAPYMRTPYIRVCVRERASERGRSIGRGTIEGLSVRLTFLAEQSRVTFRTRAGVEAGTRSSVLTWNRTDA